MAFIWKNLFKSLEAFSFLTILLLQNFKPTESRLLGLCANAYLMISDCVNAYLIYADCANVYLIQADCANEFYFKAAYSQTLGHDCTNTC